LQQEVNAMAEKVRLSGEELKNQEHKTRLLERDVQIELSRSTRGLAEKTPIQFGVRGVEKPGVESTIKVNGIKEFKEQFNILLADFKKG
jgi:hypothetical protein